MRQQHRCSIVLSHDHQVYPSFDSLSAMFRVCDTCMASGILHVRSGHSNGACGAAVQDLENTTGAWDMYGQDDAKRYPSMQNEFFNNAGDILKRREALRGFVALCKC